MNFSKLTATMYDGSLIENWKALVTFQQFLILREWRTGIVDMTLDAIQRRTNLPMEVLVEGVDILEAADARSRTPDEEGRRIVRLDPHRAWGWRVVNHEKYQQIMNDDERKAKMRARWHEKYKPRAPANPAGRESRTRPPRSQHGADDWLTTLKADPTYAGIDIDRELGKCTQWCTANHQKLSRRRFVNWLNRVERPLASTLTKTQWRERYAGPPPEELPE